MNEQNNSRTNHDVNLFCLFVVLWSRRQTMGKSDQRGGKDRRKSLKTFFQGHDD